MLTELKGFLYRISKRHNITSANAFKIFNLLKAKVKNKLNCNTENCNKSFLISHIKQNSIFGIFSNLNNFDYDLLIDMICGTVCADLYNIQFVPENSTLTCDDDDRANEQTMTIFIRNEGETTLPAGYVFTLSFTNVNEPYTIDSGFCTIVGNELTTKAILLPGGSFSVTIVSFNDKCDPVMSVISIIGNSLLPVDDLYLTLPNMDLKLAETEAASCEEGRMTVKFTLDMSNSVISNYTVAPTSEYRLIWFLNGSNINLLDYGGNVTITSGFGAVASLNTDFSLLTVETAWTTNITDELYLTVEIDNALCDDYELSLTAIPLFPYIDIELNNNTVSSIFSIPFYHLSGGPITQVCKDNRDIYFDVINTSNQILPMGTVFDLVWTGLPGGAVFMDTIVGDISVDGLTITLLNDIGINAAFTIMIRITDTGCASPITGISLTITTDDLVLTNPPLVMSM